jgi:TetR/AcrR family transcriptional regulator, cholesterol catabolism regulator
VGYLDCRHLASLPNDR